MNFLSHYYFDRYNENPYEVLGIILPDLLKNANKSWNIHPEKKTKLFESEKIQNSILNGWKRHLEVDRLFHGSAFFKHHQHQIKLVIRDSIKESPVKPFFLGHISLELMLDSLLILKDVIEVEEFYRKLDGVSSESINLFLSLNGISDLEQFNNFFERFKKEKYVYNYAKDEQITYALKQICKRLWKDPFTIEQEGELTLRLADYKKKLGEDFIIIFDHIDAQLN